MLTENIISKWSIAICITSNNKNMSPFLMYII
jgi:hypothetical protein